jgi:hypothetical protein
MKPLEMSAAEYRAMAQKGKPGRSLFRRSAPEKRTEDGVTFESLANLARYRELKRERAETPGMWFIRNPHFDLAGARYTADFLVVRPANVAVPTGNGGTFLNLREWVTVEEVKPARMLPRFKAQALRAWKRNAAQMRTLYPEVRLVLVER